MHEREKPFAIMHRYCGVAVENDEIIDKVDRWPYVHGTFDFPSRDGIGQKLREEIPPDYFQIDRFFSAKLLRVQVPKSR